MSKDPPPAALERRRPQGGGSGVAYAGTEDDFPNYVLKVLGRDRTWMEHGSCRGHDLVRKRAWTVGPGESVVVGGEAFHGRELIRAAIAVCAGCPAQYHCAQWAVEVREESGTWSMRHDDLLWLTRQPDAEGVINRARMRGEAVHVAVERLRAHRRRAKARRAVSSAS